MRLFMYSYINMTTTTHFDESQITIENITHIMFYFNASADCEFLE